MNNFAIDSAGIGEALQRSAASFNAANTDLSKSIALITATNEVVQDPDSVGTLWKTMSARIRGASTELNQLGEETDEYTQSTSKLRDLVMGLTGFDIMLDENTFKDIYEIILGIGEEWHNLTDIEQASLGEALAGKRNANALYAVLGNLDTLQDAYKTAEESAGSAMREQENYEKSIQYSIDRLNASVEEWSNNLVSSDVIKFFVDLLNVIVEISNTLTPLGTLAVGGGIFAGVKNVGKIKKDILELIKYQKNLAVANGIQLSSWEALKAGITSSTKVMTKWLLTTPTGWAVLATTAVLGLAAAFNHVSKAGERAREATEEAINNYKSISSEVNNVASSIKELNEQINGLNPITDSEDIKNLEIEKGLLEAELAILKEKQRLAKEEADNVSQESLNTTQGSKYATDDQLTYYGESVGYASMPTPKQVTQYEELDLAMDKYSEYQKELSDLQAKFKDMNEGDEGYSKTAKRISDLGEMMKEVKSHANELAISIQEQAKGLSGDTEESKKLKDAISNTISEYVDFTEATDASTESLKANAEAQKDVNAQQRSFSKTEMISQISEMSDGFESLKKIYESISNSEPFDFTLLNDNDFKNTFSSLGDAYTNFIEQVTNTPNDISTCQSAFDTLVTEWIKDLGILNGITKENANVAVSMLERMGVTNAKEIVNQMTDIVEAEYDILNDAEVEFFEVYQRYLESKDEADLEYLKSASSNNGKLISALGETYQKDYQNWCQLLTKKAESYNAFVEALGGSYDSSKSIMGNLVANTTGTIREEDIARAEKLQAQYQKYADLAAAQENALKLDLSGIKTNFSSSYNPIGGTSGNSGASTSKTEETIDHIATKIERLEREIESLGKTANATYKTWEERNGALSEQITKTTEEIALQEEALAYYQKKANSVGLSKEYQDLVKHGAIKVDTIKDEKLANKIQEYQEWYDKILACEDAVEDLNAELASLAKQKFDNISSEFDNKFSSIEHEMNVLEALIDQTETRGHIVSTKYYDSLIEAEKKNIELLEQEYEQLANELGNAMVTGDIKEGSEDWHAMKESINEVKLEIIEANTELIEFENSIRDLEWENFDRLQEKISAITDEAEFLISLMEDSELYDDNGQLTDVGMATMGLHAQNYNVLMNQADQYANEIEDINEQLANDPNNEKLLDKKQELIELQRESILAANDEKMAIRDMVEEGINLELDALKELIDGYNEALDSAKELSDYQKNVSKQVKDIATLRKRLSAFEGDNSEENKARIQELKVQLEEAEENLEQTEYEFYISEQKKILDELYD